ncbi:MAG: transporter [Burkholderiales bacterium]|nr:MAG: transporter [Burkholderiales bacterium]
MARTTAPSLPGLRRAAALAFAAASVLAPTPPAAAEGLVEAWHAALRADPDLAVSRAARAAGAARGNQAATLWQPQVSVSALGGIGRSESAIDGARFGAPGFGTAEGASFRTSVDGGSGRIALQARQPLWSGELTARGRQLGLAGEAAEHAWRAAGQTAMLRVATQWLEVSLAMRALEVATRQQAAVDRALAEATDRWRIGDAPVVGTHEARARAEAVRAQAIAARAELALREAAFADLTGRPVGTLRPGAVSAAPEDPAPGTLQHWLDAAADGNADVRALDVAVRVARAEADVHARGAQASVDLVASASRERIGGSGDFGPASSAATQGLVGVQISVPLWTGGQREARREEALRLAERADAELDRARRRVALEVRAAWLGLETGAQRIAALEQSRIASAARLQTTRTGLEVGDRTTLDVLNAENDSAQAELALAQARIARLIDGLRLAALAGTLDEAGLARVDARLGAQR